MMIQKTQTRMTKQRSSRHRNVHYSKSGDEVSEDSDDETAESQHRNAHYSESG